MVKRELFYHLLGFLLFSAISLGKIHPTPVFEIRADAVIVEELNSHLEIWPDPSSKVTIPELDLENFRAMLPAEVLPRHGATWGYIRLKNLNPENSSWVLNAGMGTYSELWMKKNGQWVCKKSGQKVKVSELDVVQGIPYHCKFFLELPYKEETEVFIKLENKFRHPVLDLSLIKGKQWQQASSNRDIFQGMLHGMSLIMLLYNLLYFLYSRDKTYLYYCFYIFVTGFYLFHWQGYSRIYFLGEFPEIDRHVALLHTLLPASYLPFMRSMTNTPVLLPALDKWIKRMIYAGLSIFPIGFFTLHITQDAGFTYLFLNILLLIQMIIIFFFIRALFKTKNRLAHFFIMGVIALWTPSLAGIIIFITTGLAVAVEIVQIGVALELLIFSIGLGYRARLNENQRKYAQDQLIIQLKENEKIQLQAKEELEEKVQLRTLQLEEEKDKALIASRAKADFLSVMSHEIRTPMNAVIGMTNILLMENPREDQADNLDTLKFSAENLLSLINNILDYNKIEAGKISLEQVNFQLSKLMTALISGNKVATEEKGIALHLKMSPEIPDALIGDPTRLIQILNNLTTNAIKFTAEGSVCVQVELLSKTEEHARLRFAVIDTGIGIAPENHHKIFETFTQAQSSTTREYGGTGLGLSIIQKLLQLHNSKIDLHSEEGKGSTFSFEIEYEIGEIEVSADVVLSNKKLEPEIPLDGIHILLVEDNPVNAKIADKFFRKWGAITEIATNGQLALELLAQKEFDLIMMDLQMPVMDGYEASRQIRTSGNPTWKQIPILALTANAHSEVLEEVLSAGMDGWVAKPFQPQVLLEKIQTVLQEKGFLLVQ